MGVSMPLSRLVAAITLTAWVHFMLACASPGRPVEETAREVLTVRLIGFIVIIVIAFIFVFRNLRKK